MRITNPRRYLLLCSLLGMAMTQVGCGTRVSANAVPVTPFAVVIPSQHIQD